MNVAAVILAAGFSRRLGQPKQLVTVGGANLLQLTVKVALGAGLSPVVVVVQDATVAEGVLADNVRVVVNPNASEGMAASIRCGVQFLGAAQGLVVDGAVILACDQVGLAVEHVRALVEDRTRIKASRYEGRTAVPAYFPHTRFTDLLALHGDQGARALIRNAEAVQDEGLALDIDTPEDLQRARALYGE
ncbi:NTP transferase domain-containing protein [Granulicella cerasi]|uniref:NTP transferase domain-containing protein n=1 Tax=Granulicella cerasi TaxID=741063 RepID=A0ABW1Z966_9BACT|nr:nucleotidyltransferase family protein [Granulicella cerasi]